MKLGTRGEGREKGGGGNEEKGTAKGKRSRVIHPEITPWTFREPLGDETADTIAL